MHLLKTICRADWRDASQYPNATNTSPVKWAWEFLRRNPDYSADWDRVAMALRAVAQRRPDMAGYVECLIKDSPDDWKLFKRDYVGPPSLEQAEIEWYEAIDTAEEMQVYRPPRNDGETHAEYVQRVASYQTEPLQIALGAKWQLSFMASPANPSSDLFRVEFLPRQSLGVSLPNLDHRYLKKRLQRPEWLAFCERSILEQGDKFPGMGTLAQEHIAVSFDLRYPLKSQFEAAQRWLESKQNRMVKRGHIETAKAHKKQPREWVNYLRALDADADGIEAGDIVKVLLPGEAKQDTYSNGYAPRKKVEAWIAAGRDLAQDGYKVIALIPGQKRPARAKAK